MQAAHEVLPTVDHAIDYAIDDTTRSEDCLVALGRARGPLRRVAAALAGRLSTRRAWEPLGYARLGDYARERLGLSSRMLQELARVESRLADLPRLEAALVSGQLPWSKVRLLARVASTEDEAWLIERAQLASVRELERSMRSVDRSASGNTAVHADEEGASLEPMSRLELSVPRRVAFLWQRTRRYAAQQSGEATPPARVLEWVTGEVISGLDGAWAHDSPEEEATRDEHFVSDGPRRPDGDAEEPMGAEAANVCAPGGRGHEPPPAPIEIPAFLQPLLAGLDDVSPHELDARLRRVLRLEQRLDAEIAPLLRRVGSPEYEWRERDSSRDALARECLGMSPRKARALVALERAGDRCPELRRAFRDGALSWVQAQAVARLIASGEAHNEGLGRWVEFAQRVSVRTLEEAVDRAQLMRDTDPASWEALRGEPERFWSGLAGQSGSGGDSSDGKEGKNGKDGKDRKDGKERQTCAHSTDPQSVEWPVRIRLTAPREVAELFRRVLSAVRLAIERETGRLPSEGVGFEAMLCHALEAWEPKDPWLRARARRAKREYAIFERDGWRCSVPGCTSQRNLQAHHIVFRSAGGSDESENLTTLCAFHHLRGVHGGFVRITGCAPQRLRFELGTRERGRPLVSYRSGDELSTLPA